MNISCFETHMSKIYYYGNEEVPNTNDLNKLIIEKAYS